nr:Chain F, EncB targeting peptide [Myxococcus xanthus]7S2T_G Chain G, EncB targeting peptide [Myxococcus xanthus]7S2T_H Chain H, EncB targeting peptide [Myxococcus xanthus]
ESHPLTVGSLRR